MSYFSLQLPAELPSFNKEALALLLFDQSTKERFLLEEGIKIGEDESNLCFPIPADRLLDWLRFALRAQAFQNLALLALPAKTTGLNLGEPVPLSLEVLEQKGWGLCPVRDFRQEAFAVIICLTLKVVEATFEFGTLDTDLPWTSPSRICLEASSQTYYVTWPRGSSICRAFFPHGLPADTRVYLDNGLLCAPDPEDVTEHLASALQQSLQSTDFYYAASAAWKLLPLPIDPGTFRCRVQNHRWEPGVSHCIFEMRSGRKEQPILPHLQVRVTWHVAEETSFLSQTVLWDTSRKLSLLLPREAIGTWLQFGTPALLSDADEAQLHELDDEVQWKPRAELVPLWTADESQEIERLKTFVVLRWKPKSTVLSIFQIIFEQFPLNRWMAVDLEVQLRSGSCKRFQRVVDLTIGGVVTSGMWVPQEGLAPQELSEVVPNSARICRLRRLDEWA